VRTYQRVVRIEPQAEGFAVHAVCTLHGAPATYRTRCVLVCTGVWGKARRLQVEGAELPHVLTRYDEPIRFWRKRVLIVGAGNSAGEAAIRLADADAHVWLAVDQPRLEQCKFRPFILREVLLRVDEKRITPLTEAHIRRIQPDCVELRCAEGVESLPVDFVLTLIGLEPDRSSAGAVGHPVRRRRQAHPRPRHLRDACARGVRGGRTVAGRVHLCRAGACEVGDRDDCEAFTGSLAPPA
jgi:thioredoxin reductase (NADPH)